MIAVIFGTIATATSIIGLLPQIYKTYVTKSSVDISMLMLLNFLICSFCWVIYSLYYDMLSVLISNLICSIINLIAIFQKFYYDKLLQ